MGRESLLAAKTTGMLTHFASISVPKLLDGLRMAWHPPAKRRLRKRPQLIGLKAGGCCSSMNCGQMGLG